jgi:acyl-CoA thioester hydrolase
MKLPRVTSTIQIRFSDLDPLGHVSNSVYTQYFDLGRMDFFRKVSETSVVPANVVATVQIDMLHEITLQDEVTVETWCSKMGNKSMTLKQNIYANGECVTKSSIVLVGFDRESRKPIALPAEWEASE